MPAPGPCAAIALAAGHSAPHSMAVPNVRIILRDMATSAAGLTKIRAAATPVSKSLAQQGTGACDLHSRLLAADIHSLFTSFAPDSSASPGDGTSMSAARRCGCHNDTRRKTVHLKKILGFFAIGGLLVLAAPAARAQALSLLNPGIAAAVQDEAKVTTEVRWHHHHGWRHRHWGWRHRHWGWRHHRWHHRH